MSLTDSQRHWLRWMVTNGGEATVQGNRIICLANNEKSSASSAIAFLHLLSKGALFINGGRLVVSDYGRRLLKP